jgi:activator of 2-hydroxyglutaryl-CoA dehydratase
MDICAGIHESIARRIHGMAFKVGIESDVALTGGCAQNKALRKYLEKRLRLPLAELNENPQLMGALGAALFALEN